jgi:hypothetical protein
MAERGRVAGVAGRSSPTVANGVVYSQTTESGGLFALGVDANKAGQANAPEWQDG